MGWVCLSDLHAGGLTSFLHTLPDAGAEPNVVTAAFTKALQAFLKDAGFASPDTSQATLILLGDVLDLQFSKRRDATDDAISFLGAVQQTGCFAPEVIATAGNHDHRIWAQARLALETEAVRTDSDQKTPSASAAFSRTPAAQSGLLDAVVQKAGFASVDLRYPNIGFARGDRIVMLHHGHYIESEYRLISTIKDALCDREAGQLSAERIAAENASWIDFAWSPFDDAENLEELYQNFLTTAGFRRITGKWTDKAAAALSAALPFPGRAAQKGTVRAATKLGFDVVFGRARDTERMAEVQSLTKGGHDGLKWYLEQPVLGQITDETSGVTDDVTFVMGHTHRPFAMRLNADGFRAPVRVYNTGGWTLNGPRLDNAEGAAVVLIDDDLNVASLRLFSTPRNGVVPAARIEMLSNGTPQEAAFLARLNDSLANTKDLWEDLREAARQAYLDRQKHLLELTGDPESEDQ